MLRFILLFSSLTIGLLAGQSLAGSHASELVADPGFAHHFVLFLHQLLLVYWLGPDIAVFIWSRKVVNTDLDVEQRVTAGRMMTTIDIVPRVCLSLFLTVAGILSDTYGISHPWWQMAGIVLLGPVWLSLVLLAWINRGTEFGETVARYDLWLRALLVVGIPVSVTWSVMTGRLEDTPWIAGKLMLLALIIGLGLIMRLKFRDFFAGLEKLARDGQSTELDATLTHSLASARPYGHATWALLLIASMMGIVKPGDANSGEPSMDRPTAMTQPLPAD